MNSMPINPPDPQNPENPEQQAVPADQLVQALSGLSKLLSPESAGAVQETIAGIKMMETEPEEDLTKEDALPPPSQQNLPEWAQGIKNSEKLFAKDKLEDLALWQPDVTKASKYDSKQVFVYFKRDEEVLYPGQSTTEQPIALEAVDNSFSVDEWNEVVKPILKRYVKAIELRYCLMHVRDSQEDYTKRVQQLLPDVFPGEHELFPKNKADLIKGNTRRQILDKWSELNTNPEILIDWINQALRPSAKKVTGAKAFSNFQGTQTRKRLQKLAKEQGEDEYIAEMAEKISRLGAQLLDLNIHHKHGIYTPEKLKKDYVESPYVRSKLHELTEKAVRQQEEGKGMISIVGDMGTGKNYLVEHFAATTNRPYFHVPCSSSMDAADLGFHFELRGGESITVPSQLAKGLQTKNSVILIDEPNSLHPDVISALHGLADHNRKFVYNGVSFTAAEGVVIVMAMNPATYDHVKNMPQAMADRSLGQDMFFDYPPLTKLDQLAQQKNLTLSQREEALQEDKSLEFFICDEALLLKNKFPNLAELPEEQFMLLWDCVINETVSELDLADLDVQKYRQDLVTILNILRIADIWRKKYKKQDMSRTISLRGTLAVAEECQRNGGDVTQAFLSLFVPNSLKYDGGDQDYENLAQIVNDKAEIENAALDVDES